MLLGEHSAILLTFIKLPSVIKIFVLSIFEWPLKTGFTVYIGNSRTLKFCRISQSVQSTKIGKSSPPKLFFAIGFVYNYPLFLSVIFFENQ